jgi:RNA recognition motif-containing protein
MIADLFAEYGVVSVSVVRDADKQPKGFAFVEVTLFYHMKLTQNNMNYE